MISYDLKIAGISVRLESEFPLRMTENYMPFQTKPKEDVDEFFDVAVTDGFPEIPVPTVWAHDIGHTRLNGHEVVLRRLGDKVPYLMEEIYAPGKRRVRYRISSNEQPVTFNQFFNNLPLEEILKRHGTMILHSSLVRWNGKAILFSAPSGTGKSTQADLWEKYMGSETLNGDRSGLRKIDGVWIAHGLPYAGSSGIYRNESAPIAAIVMLSPGPENVIEPLRPAQCLRRIFPEVTLHRWDPEFMDWGIRQITDLVSSVPCYHLSCRPDRGAVELLHKTIQREV